LTHRSPDAPTYGYIEENQVQEAGGMGWTAFTSRMGRRIAWVLGLCAVVPVALFAFAVAREANSTGIGVDERRLTDISSLFADVIRAILTNNAYANLHTTRFPGGEVRGPVTAHREDDDK